MFWFLLIAMVVVVAAVTLAVVGGGESAVLTEAAPERLVDPLPVTRPVGRADVEALRLPVTPRGYRMADVDDVLDRLGAELAERDARIAELESALAGRQAREVGPPELFDERPGGLFEKRPGGAADEGPFQGPARSSAEGPDDERGHEHEHEREHGHGHDGEYGQEQEQEQEPEQEQER
ncbi:DivIVA domain-containing protein [Streptomyces sp. NPDC007861]|uniref:DivIVA domain-containing protein n=1 Tax=Streptomyces sp. NPDC007861 TaxID=3154893 RepID=UPI0033F76E2D